MAGVPEDAIEISTLDEGRAVIRRLLGLASGTSAERVQLEHALTSRIQIEQAKGILAERFDVSTDAAFDLLRRAARSERRKLAELAGDVVRQRGRTPAAIERLRREVSRG